MGKRPTTRELTKLSPDVAFAVADAVHREILSKVTDWRKLRTELAALFWTAIHVEFGGKTVWQLKGCDSPKEYFALPEAVKDEGIDIGYRMVQRYSRVHGAFSVGLGMTADEYRDISTDKLEMLIPVVWNEYTQKPKASRMEVHRWLAIAQGHSRSKLRERIHEHLHPPATSKLPPLSDSSVIPPKKTDPSVDNGPSWAPPPGLEAIHSAFADESHLRAGGKLFEKFSRQGICVLYGLEDDCQKKPVTCHHFPRTKGAGGGDGMTLPLCPLCHAKYQGENQRLWSQFQNRITDYLYSTIHCLLELLHEQAKNERRGK